MNDVYVLEHLHVLNGDEEDVKMIGVYRSREAGLAAIERLRNQPGFRDFPKLIERGNEGPDGFYLNGHQLDQDSWAEGFFTA
jgi:hypothetical protein